MTDSVGDKDLKRLRRVAHRASIGKFGHRNRFKHGQDKYELDRDQYGNWFLRDRKDGKVFQVKEKTIIGVKLTLIEMIMNL